MPVAERHGLRLFRTLPRARGAAPTPPEWGALRPRTGGGEPLSLLASCLQDEDGGVALERRDPTEPPLGAGGNRALGGFIVSFSHVAHRALAALLTTAVFTAAAISMPTTPAAAAPTAVTQTFSYTGSTQIGRAHV